MVTRNALITDDNVIGGASPDIDDLLIERVASLLSGSVAADLQRRYAHAGEWSNFCLIGSMGTFYQLLCRVINWSGCIRREWLLLCGRHALSADREKHEEGSIFA